MNWNPHPYQLRAMKLMLSQSSLGLFLDPGLGKTSTWLGAFSTLKSLGLVDKMLVIVPLNPMYDTWPREIEKYEEFNHLRYTFLHGKYKRQNLGVDTDIFLINPEGVQWLVEHCQPHQLADVLCIDESTKFKNTQSKRFKSLKRVFPKFQRRWIGTGTPSPNGLEDLFGQIYILDGGYALGKYVSHFRERWFYQEAWNIYEWHPKDNALAEITQAIAPLSLQMSAEDYLQMPTLLPIDKVVNLPAKAQKLYQEIEKEYIGVLPDTDTALVASSNAAAGAKCRQIANGAVYVEGKNWELVHNAKLDLLEELIEEIGRRPVVIVYEFQHDAQRICSKYPEAKLLTGLSGDSFRNAIANFNAGRIQLLVIQASAGHGLNIQDNCHHMIWFGLTWNWEYYKQMVDRLYRQGQKASMVFVYRLLAASTLDEEVAKRLRAKEEEEYGVKRAIKNYRSQDEQ